MFKQAVDHHNASSNPRPPLEKQLFPSSSPGSSPITNSELGAASSNRTAFPLGNASINRVRPAGPTVTSFARAPEKSGPSGTLKRTSSGLAKAFNNNDPFQEVVYPQLPQVGVQKNNTLNKENTIPRVQNTQVEEDIFINEDDFDSDVDLDVENPSAKGFVKPSVPMSRQKVHSTPQPAEFARENDIRHSQIERSGSVDSGYASIVAPKPEARPKPKSIKDFAYQAPRRPSELTGTVTPSAKRHVDDDEAPPPTKRRTLPWLQEQPEERKEKTYRTTKTVTGSFTPLPKNTQKSNYPWNTTASAVKEQAKKYKALNKAPIKEQPATDPALIEAAHKRKKQSVASILLSHEQKHVLELVVEKKKSVFFTGSAGTGKSVLLRQIIQEMRKVYLREPDRLAVTASTGLAACNIGGVTLHSFAGIGLGKGTADELVKNIKRNQKAKHRWMRTKVLVVDEISMVDGELFDKLEEVARRLRNNGRPFGGIQLVITGDFFQLPPVPDRGKVAKFCFDAETWNTSIEHTIGLHHVFRQKDPEFAGMLNEMREGRLSQKSIKAFKSLDRELDSSYGFNATELFSTRNEVDHANNSRMQQLVGQTMNFDARDAGTITDKATRDKILSNCMAPEVVQLKKGAQVMLIKNMDDTLVNGSLGKVIGFMNEATWDTYQAHEEAFQAAQDFDGDEEELGVEERRMRDKVRKDTTNGQPCWPVVRFVNADGSTRDLLCHRESWKVELPNGEVQASRAQIPLILAWALSIHKAQGQTLERVKVDLGKVFEKGQAYVALSRATSMQGLQVLRFDPSKVNAHPKVGHFYANLSRVEATMADTAGKGKKGTTSAGDYEDEVVGRNYF